MKFFKLLTGVGVALALSATANAKIVTGTSQGYFSSMYATDLTGQHTPQYDKACKDKHWALLNTSYYAEFRVNTDTNNNVTYLDYARAETVLTNSGFNPNVSKYVFKSGENALPNSLKEMGAQYAEFTLDYEMWHSSTKIVFNPVTTTSSKDDGCSCTQCDCHHGGDCHHVTTTYQCVLSTY